MAESPGFVQIRKFIAIRLPATNIERVFSSMRIQIARVALFAALVPACVFLFSAEEKFKTLFDGKSLEGWVQHGGKATYKIEKGVIVGTAVPDTPNSFLCTRKHYGDFILELEFKVDSMLNSGVQIRSHVYEKDTTIQIRGKKRKKKAGTVYGYQVEIDPSARAYSGGVYDEARRGWLNDLKDNEAARKAFKQGDWNSFRIICKGDSIRTWINGVAAADFKDSMTAKGFIALQVHGVGKRKDRVGKQVRWRNIRIAEL